ncbi:MAG: hypothetical protein ABR985_17335 [Methanotrichaceae archaeon]
MLEDLPRPAPEDLIDVARVLDNFYIPTRYPNGHPLWYVVSAHDHLRQEKYRYENRRLSPDEAIAELNHRFREHGVGYQYESGMMMRVDSQIIHEEIVRPALSMLSDPMYEGANAEFLSAHEHYRTKKYKECLNDCLKAFESTIKAICS